MLKKNPANKLFEPKVIPEKKVLQPEHEAMDKLIVRCLSSEWDDAAWAEVVAAFNREEFPWQIFDSRAKDTQAIGYLYRLFKKRAFDYPLSVAWQGMFWRLYRNNMIILDEFFRIQTIFTQHNLTVILLKGPISQMDLYDNPSVRSVGDIDILAKKSDFKKISGLLVSAGYVVDCDQELDEEGCPVLDHHLVFNRILKTKSQPEKESKLRIEVHYSLWGYHYRMMSQDWLWRNLMAVDFEGRKITVLDIDTNFLALLGHLWVQHEGDEITHLFDLANYLIKYGREMNWAKVALTAYDYELIIPLRRLFCVLRSEWHFPLPKLLLSLFALLPVKEREKHFFAQEEIKNSWFTRFSDDISSGFEYFRIISLDQSIELLSPKPYFKIISQSICLARKLEEYLSKKWAVNSKADNKFVFPVNFYRIFNLKKSAKEPLMIKFDHNVRKLV